MFADIFMRREIDNIKVKCINVAAGCGWNHDLKFYDVSGIHDTVAQTYQFSSWLLINFLVNLYAKQGNWFSGLKVNLLWELILSKRIGQDNAM